MPVDRYEALRVLAERLLRTRRLSWGRLQRIAGEHDAAGGPAADEAGAAPATDDEKS